MKKLFAVLAALCAVTLTACFSPWSGTGVGTITIAFGTDGPAGRFITADTYTTVSLTGPDMPVTDSFLGGGPLSIAVTPGLWRLELATYLSRERKTLLATGSTVVNVTAGADAYAEVAMTRVTPPDPGPQPEPDPPPIASVGIDVAAPYVGKEPASTAAGEGNFTVYNVSWYPAHDKFEYDYEYTVTITLTASAGYVFNADTTFTVNGYVVENPEVANYGRTVTLEHTFDAMQRETVPELIPIESAGVTVTAPYVGKKPASTATGEGNFTVTGVSWDPAHDKFRYDVAYTVTITLTAGTGYFFEGNATFTVNGTAVVAPVIAADGSTATLSRVFDAIPDPGPKETGTANITITVGQLRYWPEGVDMDLDNITVTLLSPGSIEIAGESDSIRWFVGEREVTGYSTNDGARLVLDSRIHGNEMRRHRVTVVVETGDAVFSRVIAFDVGL